MEGLLLLLLLPGLLAEWTEWPEADRSPSPDFLFPDQLPRLRKALPAIAAGPVPRGCGAGREFCEVVEDYPEPAALRRKVASSMGRLEADMVFSPLREGEVGEVRARLRGQPSAADPGADSSARGAFSSESPACDSMQSFVYPRTARNAGRQWRFVVNVPGEEEGEESYVQAVKVERCLREGQACNMATAGYDTTVCRQKYSYRRLLALGEDGHQYVDSFRFPSCCVCYTQRSLHSFQLLRNGQDSEAHPSLDPDTPTSTNIDMLQSKDSGTSLPMNQLELGGNRFVWQLSNNSLRGGRQVGGGEGEVEESRSGGGCKNRFCQSRERAMGRMGRARRKRRRRRRKLGVPLTKTPQSRNGVVLL